MVWYLNLEAQQEPFDLSAPDEPGRPEWGFNLIGWKRPSATAPKELIAILEAAGVGTERVNLFAGTNVVTPSGPGPFLVLRVTEGLAPVGTHNAGRAAYRRPGVQVIVRGESPAAVQAMAHAAFNAFAAVTNREVVA